MATDTAPTPRPTLLPVQVENIPTGLPRGRRWVCFRLEWDGTKYTKVPYQPNGQKASSTDPATWSPFTEVVEAYRAGGFDGIGFMLTQADSIAGADIDHCRNPETGELTPFARHVAETLDSYTEVSPSGTGIRLLARAVLPPSGRKNPDFGAEFYDDTRFLTITGHRLETARPTIERRPREMLALHAEVFGERDAAATPKSATERAPANPERDAATIAAIVEAWPRTEEERKACSRHDHIILPAAGFLVGRTDAAHALELLLAAVEQAEPSNGRDWTGEVQRAVNDSARKREAGERYYGLPRLEEYRPRLAERLAELWAPPRWEVPDPADASVDETLPLRYQLLTPQEMKQRPPQEWLVHKRVPKNVIAIIDGPPGTFKSILAMDLHLSAAAGLDCLGEPVAQGASLYIAAEGSAGLGARIRAWEVAREIEAPADAYFLPEAVQLLQQQDRTDLLLAVRRLPTLPVLVIIDTLSRSIAGFDENSSKDMSLLIEVADQLRRATGATVIFLHHTNRGQGTIRGSSALPAGIDTQIELKREGDLVTITCVKQKDAEEFPPITLTKKVIDLGDWQSSVVLEPEQDGLSPTARLAERVYQLLAETFGDLGATTTQWETVCDDAGVKHTTFYRARTLLLDTGRVLSTGTGRGARYRPCATSGTTEAAEVSTTPLGTEPLFDSSAKVPRQMVPSGTFAEDAEKNGAQTPTEGTTAALVPSGTEAVQSKVPRYHAYIEDIGVVPTETAGTDPANTLIGEEVSGFIAACCTRARGCRVPLSDFHRAYVAWCRAGDHRPLPPSDLLTALRWLGVSHETSPTLDRPILLGVGLRADAPGDVEQCDTCHRPLAPGEMVRCQPCGEGER